MKLTIGFSTLAERVSNIRFPSSEFEYLVLVQNPGQVSYRAPSGATLIEVAGKGVAKSRNQAILNTKTELLIFGDDDVVFHPAELSKAIKKFQDDPELVLLLLAANDETGRPRKQYPRQENELTLLNSARAATYEMMIRVDAVKQLEVRFDEKFGAGADLYLGDEYIFISDLIKAGASCEFAPIFVATHPADSSGERWGTKADRQARAAVFDRVFGKSAPVVRLAFGIRRLKMLGGIKQLTLFVFGR
jgi:hypothetical protein